MTPEPVSPPLAVVTVMLTTEGSTLAATPAYDVGTTLSEPDGSDVEGRTAVEELPSSRAAPTPTPMPPNTSADKPAAAAVVRQAFRRGAVTGGRDVSGCCGSLSSSGVGGQNRSVIGFLPNSRFTRVAGRSEQNLNLVVRTELSRSAARPHWRRARGGRGRTGRASACTTAPLRRRRSGRWCRPPPRPCPRDAHRAACPRRGRWPVPAASPRYRRGRSRG